MTKGEDIKLEWIEDRFDMQWQIVNTARIMELLHHVQHGLNGRSSAKEI